MLSNIKNSFTVAMQLSSSICVFSLTIRGVSCRKNNCSEEPKIGKKGATFIKTTYSSCTMGRDVTKGPNLKWIA